MEKVSAHSLGNTEVRVIITGCKTGVALMKDTYHKVYSIAAQNPPIPGCTISGKILSGVQCFSLSQGTDISAESYPVPVLQYNLTGQTQLFDPDRQTRITACAGELMVKPAGRNIGIIADEDSVYLEIALGKETHMNNAVKAGEIFQPKDLVPYQDGKIVNMDIASNGHMKFVVMAFDEGTGLSEHAAPGEAIVFALDGDGIIGYEGKEYPIKAGAQFHFAKGGLHSVKASSRFKMALLLVLD